MPVGNQGGIRARKHRSLVVLYTQWHDPDWPDRLEVETGTLTYYGDNKRPGYELHDTPKRGNEILRSAFDQLALRQFSNIPPFFVFSQLEGRDVRFEGVAAPGTPGSDAGEALVAIWRATDSERFQNYRASFTILDVPSVDRSWIRALESGTTEAAPSAWRRFAETGSYSPMLAPRTRTHRSKTDQLPDTATGEAIIRVIHEWFSEEPFHFEACAIELWRMIAPSTSAVEATRPSRDGGRDAVGLYGLGPESDRLQVEFALEAKCYALNNGVGVREVSRLVSRLRHRQFGVFVTTSYVADQAYQEIREDGHPIVIISAKDIVEALRARGLTQAEEVKSWLASSYPMERSERR